ncbi:hypothetical protein FPZ49_19820 [Paenibacillus cremeus]|uniref:Uncharacterized protein n=2 Tax=Paenibacillus cremeus TaxID=2163881 RepID=A0A559K855_9BACL|nr:hypothetical protein FPZ49_19820 [Paenibacillus cremeus]
MALLLLLGLGAGCSWTHKATPVDPEATQSIDVTGDLLVASDYQVFSIGSKSKHAKEVLQTVQPISSISYTTDHAVITVFNPSDPKAFRGFYLRDRNGDSYVQYATPQMAPKFSYVQGDLMFLASAEKTMQKDGEYSKAGIYQLKEHKWVKEWQVPGGIEDVIGSGKDVYFVTSNNTSTSSNIYKVDLLTGEWGPMIQAARRYPLDQTALDTNGDLYLMISQRNKSEWSNKIYRWNPQQVPYELANNFVSNTRPFSYTMKALQGKLLIARYDRSGNNPDLDKPLSLLDLKSRKQVHLAWEHQPVALDRTADEFVALGEDGALAFLTPNATEKPERELIIPELASGRWISVKK